MHDLIHIDFTANNIQTVPSHQHAFWEMIYIRVGTGLLHINSEWKSPLRREIFSLSGLRRAF